MKNYLVKNLLFLSAFLMCAFASAQTVTGVVFDADGPLPGASVVVKGTTQGTETDFDGAFTLDNVASDAVLVISYVGYKTQELAVNGQSSINVTMEGDDNVLEQVVVMGYVQQTRGDITGSVASVDMEEALKAPVANAAEALQGRVTGVNVVSSGAPGAAPQVTIRGFGSWTNSNPLYIIDGFQTKDVNILNSINPDDIEQMNVLKDGAAAIYGSRAANGVIIIKTKSGSYNKEKVEFNLGVYTGVSMLQNKPELMNANQHGNMIFQSLINDGATPGHPQYGYGSGPVVPSSIIGAPVGVTVAPNGTDWIDAITRNAPTTNINLSASNGGEKGKYFMSMNYFDRQGVLVDNGFVRFNTALRSEFAISDRITIGENLNVTYTNNTGGNGEAFENANRMTPLLPTHDDEGNYAGTYAPALGLGNTRNPLAQLERAADNYNKSLRVFGNAYLDVKLIDGLNFRSNIGMNTQVFHSRSFTKLDPEHSEPLSTNSLYMQYNNSYEMVWTNTLSYMKSFGNHNVNAVLGYEALKNQWNGMNATRTGYLYEDPTFYNLGNGSGDPITGSWEGESSMASIFFNMNYNYDSRYFLSVTVRNDTSSKFLGDNKSATFPSLSAGWNVSNEAFWPENDVVSRLKVKGSYGTLGFDEIDPYLLVDSFRLDEVLANYPINGTTVSQGVVQNVYGNPDLVWETTTSQNYGIEMGLFNEWLSVGFEYYDMLNQDILNSDSTVNPTTGVETAPPFKNIGAVRNSGFETFVNISKTTESGFRYGINLNLSKNTNVVEELASEFMSAGGNRMGNTTRTEKGRSISGFYGLEADGLDENGRINFVDQNGDGTINDEDRTYIGSPLPDFTYGINLDLGYKGFDVSALFTGSQGNDIYNYERFFTDFPLFFNGNRSTRLVNSWTPSNTNTTVPALSNTIQGNEGQTNSYLVEDGSFFKLKNLQIGYNFDSNVSEKLGLSFLRLYVQGSNIFTITDFTGVDPEIPGGGLAQGINNQVYPLSSIYTVGLNVKF
ncbi:MAG: SusC/RagA family TonB-linked outer membrane protein [Flavobacteriaceae bacterium]